MPNFDIVAVWNGGEPDFRQHDIMITADTPDLARAKAERHIATWQEKRPGVYPDRAPSSIKVTLSGDQNERVHIDEF